MKTFTMIARILLGLTFTVFGANKVIQFIPMPPPVGAAGAFVGALAATGYMLPLLGVLETVAGLMLLVGRFVPLGLALLAPSIVSIVAFHAALDLKGMPVAFLCFLFEVYLAYAYRRSFAPMLDMNAQPTDAK